MTDARTIVLPVDPALVHDCVDREGDQVTRLIATVAIFGVLHHLMLIRVRMRHIDAYGDEVAADAPACTASIQVAFHDDDQDELDNLGQLYDACFETVNVPGREGDWVAYLHPYGD